MSRSKLDLFAKVLEMARNGTTGAKIASQENLQRELVDSSLRLLTNLDLLMETRNSPVSFVTTQKGCQFLQDYQHLAKRLNSEF